MGFKISELEEVFKKANINLNNDLKETESQRQIHPNYEQALLCIVKCTRIIPLRLIYVGINEYFAIRRHVMNKHVEFKCEKDREWINRVRVDTCVQTERLLNSLANSRRDSDISKRKVFQSRPTNSFFTADGSRRLQLPGFRGQDCDYDPKLRQGNQFEAKLIPNVSNAKCMDDTKLPNWFKFMTIPTERAHQVLMLNHRISKNYLVHHDEGLFINMNKQTSWLNVFILYNLQCNIWFLYIYIQYSR